MKKLFSVFAFALALTGTAAQAALVTFDPVEEQGSTLDAGDAISAQGFNFTQTNVSPAILFAGDLVGAYASNGSSSLLAGNAAEFVLTAANGLTFNLASLEVGGGNLGDLASWASEVLLFGLTASNTTLTSTVLLDPGFTGLSLVGLNWNNLRQVEFRATAGDFSLDNISLQVVPEPASWALVGAALAILLFVRRQRAQRGINRVLSRGGGVGSIVRRR